MILPDTRGHGRSGGANSLATYAAFADDVIALMDRLGLPRASLVGFSDGRVPPCMRFCAIPIASPILSSSARPTTSPTTIPAWSTISTR